MLQVHTENIGDMAVIECVGRIAHTQSFALRDAVIAQNEARTLVLDLTEVNALERSGLSVLVSLQFWAQEHGIQFKVFNPSSSVRHMLEQISSMQEFAIASLPEVMGMMIQAQGEVARLKANAHFKVAA